MKEGKDIDQLFREGLENPEIPYNELDWKDLDRRLHPKAKRKIVPFIWYVAVAGVAALLFIVFMPFKVDVPQNKAVSIAKNKQKLKEQRGVLAERKDRVVLNTKVTPAVLIEAHSHKKNDNNSNLAGLKTKQLIVIDSLFSIAKNNQFEGLADGTATVQIVLNAKKADNSNAIPWSDKIAGITTKPRFKKLIANKPRLTLSFSLAPDLTNVQKSGNSSLSGGLGVGATLSLNQKLSITTGVAFAKKIYDADFGLYQPNSRYVFKQIPNNVHANCDVLDIPLNVNFTVYEQHKNAISLSTGLSSYIMLKEKYNYSYDDDSYTTGQSRQNYVVKNRNQHFFGVVNVGIIFQRQINSKFSLSATPFMKVPLTDIGYGNMKLQSTGVALSVNMNLSKK
jgi:hypothetical protein